MKDLRSVSGFTFFESCFSTICWKDNLSFTKLCLLLDQRTLPVFTWVCFGTLLCSVDLCLFFHLVPYCFDHCSSGISFEIRLSDLHSCCFPSVLCWLLWVFSLCKIRISLWTSISVIFSYNLIFIYMRISLPPQVLSSSQFQVCFEITLNLPIISSVSEDYFVSILPIRVTLQHFISWGSEM